MLFVSFRERLKTDLVVGRMKKPVKTFQEYCAIALQRLKLDVNRVGVYTAIVYVIAVRLCMPADKSKSFDFN